MKGDHCIITIGNNFVQLPPPPPPPPNFHRYGPVVVVIIVVVVVIVIVVVIGAVVVVLFITVCQCIKEQLRTYVRMYIHTQLLYCAAGWNYEMRTFQL